MDPNNVFSPSESHSTLGDQTFNFSGPSGAGGTSGFDSFFSAVKLQILNPIMTLLALAAFVLFVWGVVQFIAHAGDAAKRKEGQMHILWGIIGLAIIFGAKAILAIAAGTVGVPVPQQ